MGSIGDGGGGAGEGTLWFRCGCGGVVAGDVITDWPRIGSRRREAVEDYLHWAVGRFSVE